MDRLAAHRVFFANLITAKAGIAPGSELASAFASTPRERFVSQPPWRILTRSGYIEAPSDDPALLDQDVLVALRDHGSLNNGEPSLHAVCLHALAPRKGERVVHVGAGTGYYTSILAQLVGEAGVVDAYEIEVDLAERARANLAEFPHVTVHAESGAATVLPACDVLYVNAGASEPLSIWLDALDEHGRLLFPLSPEMGVGAMLLVTRNGERSYAARFVVRAQFVPCIGVQDKEMSLKLKEAFDTRDWSAVKTLRRDEAPDQSCWVAGSGWWLSMDG